MISLATLLRNALNVCVDGETASLLTFMPFAAGVSWIFTFGQLVSGVNCGFAAADD